MSGLLAFFLGAGALGACGSSGGVQPCNAGCLCITDPKQCATSVGCRQVGAVCENGFDEIDAGLDVAGKEATRSDGAATDGARVD